MILFILILFIIFLYYLRFFWLNIPVLLENTIVFIFLFLYLPLWEVFQSQLHLHLQDSFTYFLNVIPYLMLGLVRGSLTTSKETNSGPDPTRGRKGRYTVLTHSICFSFGITLTVTFSFLSLWDPFLSHHLLLLTSSI